MYKCKNCRSEFEEPATKNVAAEEYLGIDNLFPNKTRLDVYLCPNCNDDDIEVLEQCEICGEWFEELTDTTEYVNGGCGYCCEQCISDAEMIEI